LARAFQGAYHRRDKTKHFSQSPVSSFDGLAYLAGARQALLEKFANEFLSRIGGDNFVDGFLHGSRIPLG
jgi:hypothetical protein